MIDLQPPPQLILPDHYTSSRPAIIRPEVDPLKYFPVDLTRGERRAIIAELRRAGRLNDAIIPVLVPVMIKPRPATPVVTYRSTASSGSDTTSYSFANLAIGDAAPDRYVVVGATAHGANNNTCTIIGVSIGGTAATLHVAPAGSGPRANAIASRLLTTGTTATIAVSTTGTAGSIRVFVVTVTGADLSTTLDSDGSKINVWGTDPNTTQSVTLNIGRLAFFIGGGNGSSLTVNWSSATLIATMTSESGSTYPASMAYIVDGDGVHTETFTQAPATYRGIAAASFA